MRVGLLDRGSALLRLLAVTLIALAAVTACSGHSMPPTSRANPGVAAPPLPSREVHGQIIAESGSTWMVRGDHGDIYTVTITPITSFGTLFHSLSRDRFKVGDNVRVAGDFATTAITATAVTFTKRRADRPDPATAH